MIIEHNPSLFIENFNDVGVATRINVLFRDAYTKTILYYGELQNSTLTLFTGYAKQSELEEITYLLNKDGYTDLMITFEHISLYENRDDNYVKINLSLEDLKKIKLDKLKIKFENDKVRPSVDCTDIKENMFVQGGREDIFNYEAYRDLLVGTGATEGDIKGADNQFYTLTVDEMGNMILKLKNIGLQRFQEKWQKEADIANAQTIEELDAIDV